MNFLGLIPAVALSLTQASETSPESAPGGSTVPAPVVDAPPAPQEPKHKGTGLLATTGILGGTTLAILIARNVMLKKNCPLDGMTACTYDWKSDLGLTATGFSVNLAMVGFAPGAGWTLGRYHAWKDAAEGGKKRNIGAIMGAGGGLLGVGIAGVGASMALAVIMPTKCLDKEIGGSDPLAGDRCLLKAYPGYTTFHWASFAMVGSGAAMLAYGRAYKRGSAKRVADVQVTPQLSSTYTGLGLSGRF